MITIGTAAMVILHNVQQPLPYLHKCYQPLLYIKKEVSLFSTRPDVATVYAFPKDENIKRGDS